MGGGRWGALSGGGPVRAGGVSGLGDQNWGMLALALTPQRMLGRHVP